MVHLLIAKEMINRNLPIGNHANFYMGSLAPDAVIIRPNSSRADNKISHLRLNYRKEKEIENFDEWTDNALHFFKHYNEQIDYGIICGYVSHILSDIAARKKFEYTKDRAVKLHTEFYELDSRLFQILRNETIIWASLEESSGVDMANLITGHEMNQAIHSLYEQYCYRISNDSFVFKLINLDQINEFIYKEVDNIGKLLFE